MKFWPNLATLLLSMVFLTLVGCKGKAEDAGGGSAKSSAALVAETDMEKAWLAWKEEACKCSDLTCASASADARIKLEKEYPGSISAKQKNVTRIIRAANACLTKATGG